MLDFFKKIIAGTTLIVGCGLTTTLVLESCKKAEEGPKAEITIVDTAGVAVSDVKVVMFCVQRPEVSVVCNVADTQYTDGSGIVNFEFENPAVLKLSAVKLNTVERDTGQSPFVEVDTLCAEGFVTLETSEVAEEVFVLRPCGPI